MTGISIDANALVEFGIWLGLLLVTVLAISGTIRFVRGRILMHVTRSSKVSESRKKRIETIVQALSWTINVTLVVIVLMMLLGRVVDIAPLLTSLGIVGLTFSLGAQTLVKDLIGGVMVLVENQYAVGDVIQVGDVSGVVERLTLRATYVRSIEGKLHLVPNGDVRVVSNLTKEWARAMVDIGVAYEEDLERAAQVLDQVAQQFAADPEYAPQLLEAPKVIAPLSLGDWAVTMRVMVKTLPGKQWGVGAALRRRLLIACERENISLPYPRQEVLVRHVAEAAPESSAPSTD